MIAFLSVWGTVIVGGAVAMFVLNALK